VPKTPVPQFQVYTDGGADPNPGPGGWGAVILDGGGRPVRELSGSEDPSTNNRMELTAAMKALEALPDGAPAALYTDSIYLKKGITQWLPGWIARGWKRKAGELANEDLWRRLAGLVAGREISWHWVKGHAGHEHNERADELATEAIRGGRGGGGQGRSTAPEADTVVYLRVSSSRDGGGWAAVLREGSEGQGGQAELLTGTVARASANELDVLAAAEVLEGLPERRSVALYTGSDYLRNGATQWIEGWRKRGWTTKAGTPVKNREAWERLARAMDRREVLWPSIKGRLPEGWKELGKMARGAAGE
jgi:ribonuclease HI